MTPLRSSPILPFVLVLACFPLFAGDAILPEKLRSVLEKLDTYEAEQIAAAELAIEKKRAEVADYLRTEMQVYTDHGKTDTAVTIGLTIKRLEDGTPLEGIRSRNDDSLTAARGRAQSVFRERDFEDFSQSWSGNANYKPSAKRGVLQLDVNGAGPNYEAIGVSIPLTDFSERPILRISARAEESMVMRIDLQDTAGNGTTNLPVHEKIQRSDGFRDYFFDFSGYGGKKAEVDLAKIQTIVIYVNPGASQFKGAVYFDELESTDRRG